jgi:hypothetical protein
MPRIRSLTCAFSLITALLALPMSAQNARQSPSLTPPDIARPMSTLADQAPVHTGFVFDRSMLQAAQVVLQSGGMDADRAAAALSSVSYDNYRYAEPAVYSRDAMASIVAMYHAAGWEHLVDGHDREPLAGQKPRPVTDLWLHSSGLNIDGITVLTRGSRNVNVIRVSCELRPLDLVHLSGHFGIPKVDPNAVMVPAPDGN